MYLKCSGSCDGLPFPAYAFHQAHQCAIGAGYPTKARERVHIYDDTPFLGHQQVNTIETQVENPPYFSCYMCPVGWEFFWRDRVIFFRRVWFQWRAAARGEYLLTNDPQLNIPTTPGCELL